MPDNGTGKPSNAVEITINGILVVGEMPRVPTRFLLQGKLRRALGYTPHDDEMMAAAEGDPKIEPSADGDSFAIQMIYYAVVGLCWATPMDGVLSLRESRHDVVEYGEAVFQWFYENYYHEKLSSNLTDEGLRLLSEMMVHAGHLLGELEVEKDFTPDQEEASTTA